MTGKLFETAVMVALIAAVFWPLGKEQDREQ